MRFITLAVAAVVAPLAGAAPGDPAPPAAGERRPAAPSTADQVRAAIEDHVQAAVRDTGGVYRIRDGTGRMLELEFVSVGVVTAGALWKTHDPQRHVNGRVFVACACFHASGEPPEKIFDVDLEVDPRDGKLAVTDVLVHREKQLVDGQWVWKELPRPAGGVAASAR
jgi:hypothetical protein